MKTPEDRVEIARIYLAENGFAELLGSSKVLQKGLEIAAGTIKRRLWDIF